MSDIIHGRRGITTDTAARLARFCGNSAEFWPGLQSIYDLALLDAERIEAEVEPLATAAQPVSSQKAPAGNGRGFFVRAACDGLTVTS